MPQLKSQKGSTALLVLGLIAVVVALTLEFRHRREVRAERQRQSGLREEAEFIVQGFATRLQHPETCTHALAGEVVKPGERTPVAFHFQQEDSEKSPVKLAIVELETPSVEDMRTEISDENGVATTLVRFPVYVHPRFQDEQGHEVVLNRSERSRADGGKDLEQGLPLYVWANPLDGQILACFGRNSAGALCNDLGGYFIPNTEPYHFSCRQSIKTERRLASGVKPQGTCRIGGFETKSKACKKKFGTQFAANLIQQSQSRFAPEMPDFYLCELCQ